MFRKLKAEEIECRIQSVKEKGMVLLLYKDARVDQRILDETFGVFGWQRHHSRENRNCTVSIWDKEKGQWIEKEDTGTESNTEAEKGLASDSFKRACFNWGIGRELYSAPFVWITTDGFKDKDDKFHVKSIGYDEETGDINALEIYNDTLKRVVYKMGTTVKKPEVNEKDRPKLVNEIGDIISAKKLSTQLVYKKIGVDNLNELATERMPGMIEWLNNMKEADLNKLREEK